MAKADLTAQRLRELLHYDPATGLFTRRTKVAKYPAGMKVGSFSTHGHIRVGVDGRDYYAHRLAWLFVHGEWPSLNIDHIDGNPANNSIANLRDVPQEVNNQNQRKPHCDNPTRLQGVSYVKTKNVFRASLTINKKPNCLGYFQTPEEAHNAYILAKRKHHPGCTI